MQSCVRRPHWMERICDITRGQLSIDFAHNFDILKVFLDINSPFD